MNFKTAARQINIDFCDAYFSKYMKAQWHITVGFRTVKEHIALMKKQLADWQESYDCGDALCTQSEPATIEIVSYAQLGTSCVLNRPLSAKGKRGWCCNHMNTRNVIINTFTR